MVGRIPLQSVNAKLLLHVLYFVHSIQFRDSYALQNNWNYYCVSVCICVYVCVCVCTGMPHTVCLWSSQDNFMKSFFLLTMNSWDGSQSSIMYSKHLHQLTHFVDSTLDFKLVICVITNICSCKTHITALFSYSSNLHIRFSEFHFCIYIQQYILYYLCCLYRNLIFTLLHIPTIF